MGNELDKSPAVEKSEAEAVVPATGRPTKKPLARRVLTWALWSVAGLLAFVLVAVLTLPLWISPVATSLAKSIVPKYTGTAFNVERMDLNPYTGKLRISGVTLANPEGYAEINAFSLGTITVDVEVSTLLSKTIHVREITIDSPFASYVLDANGINNFGQIVETALAKLGPKKEGEKSGETKVAIDKVTVRNARVAIGAGVFEVELITLTDFGKDTPAQIDISGVRLANPEGFSVPNAFTVKAISIGMETADLSKKPLVFHDILIDSPSVFNVDNDVGEDNFDVIFKPLKGGDKEEKKEEKKDDDTPSVMIDKLEIVGTKLQYGKIDVPFIPQALTFTDIGKKKDGHTLKDLYESGVKKVKSAGKKLGTMLDKVNPANLWK